MTQKNTLQNVGLHLIVADVIIKPQLKKTLLNNFDTKVTLYTDDHMLFNFQYVVLSDSSGTFSVAAVEDCAKTPLQSLIFIKHSRDEELWVVYSGRWRRSVSSEPRDLFYPPSVCY